MKQKFLLTAIAAVVLRIILSLISFHPDIQAFAFGDFVIKMGNFGNFYDFLARFTPPPGSVQNYPVDFFIYPPAIYFYHAFFYMLYSPLLGSDSISNFLFNVPHGLGNFQFNLELLFLKVPYMVIDIPAAFIFAKLFEGEKKYWAFVLWLFNPVSLYATYLQGQFDIIPTSIVILSLFVLYKQKKFLNIQSEGLAAILLGLGAAFKIYPIFLLVALVSLRDDWSTRIKLLVYGFLGYFVTILPYLFSHGFRSSALLAGLTTKSLYAQIPISGGEAILLFEAVMLFFYMVFLSRRVMVENLWQRFFIILLVFFIFTHYHPQWFVWLSPFLIIELLKNNFKNLVPTLLALFSFTALLFFFDPSLTLGLFAPISPSLYNGSSVWTLIHLNLDYNTSKSVLQTIFVGSAIYFLYSYFPKSE